MIDKCADTCLNKSMSLRGEMTRKNKSLTVSCPPQAKIGLEQLAARFGFMWGDKPNISLLIVAIGLGQVTVVDKVDESISIVEESSSSGL